MTVSRAAVRESVRRRVARPDLSPELVSAVALLRLEVRRQLRGMQAAVTASLGLVEKCGHERDRRAAFGVLRELEAACSDLRRAHARVVELLDETTSRQHRPPPPPPAG